MSASEHGRGCSMWHHQGGDYDRDCEACMEMAAEEQRVPGTLFNPADPAGWPKVRGPGSEDAIDMSEFTLGPLEILCTACWLIHRPGVECP